MVKAQLKVAEKLPTVAETCNVHPNYIPDYQVRSISRHLYVHISSISAFAYGQSTSRYRLFLRNNCNDTVTDTIEFPITYGDWAISLPELQKAHLNLMRFAYFKSMIRNIARWWKKHCRKWLKPKCYVSHYIPNY